VGFRERGKAESGTVAVFVYQELDRQEVGVSL